MPDADKPAEPGGAQKIPPSARDSNETADEYWGWLIQTQRRFISASDDDLTNQWKADHPTSAKAPRSRLVALRNQELAQLCTHTITSDTTVDPLNEYALQTLWTTGNPQIPYSSRVTKQLHRALREVAKKANGTEGRLNQLFKFAVEQFNRATTLPLVGPLFTSAGGIAGLAILISIFCWRLGIAPEFFFTATLVVGILLLGSLFLRQFAVLSHNDDPYVKWGFRGVFLSLALVFSASAILALSAYSFGKPDDLARALHQLAGTARPAPPGGDPSTLTGPSRCIGTTPRNGNTFCLAGIWRVRRYKAISWIDGLNGPGETTRSPTLNGTLLLCHKSHLEITLHCSFRSRLQRT
jgi:hypothetical protein